MKIVHQLMCFLCCCLLGACVSRHETMSDYYVIPCAGDEIPKPHSREGALGSPGYVSVQPVLFNIKTSNLVSRMIVGEKMGAIYPPVFVASVQPDRVVVTNAAGKRFAIPVMDTSEALRLRDVIMQKMRAAQGWPLTMDFMDGE